MKFWKDLGFSCQYTPKKYTGIPDKVISKPPNTIKGDSITGSISRKIQISTNTIGTAMCTFIGLDKFGFFHLKYNKPDTDTVTNSDSTIVQYWISI